MVRVPCGVGDMRAHPDGCAAQRAERGDVLLQLRLARGNDGHLLMTVGAGAAVAGDMLDDARDARGFQPFQHRAAQRRDPHRIMAQRAVADHVMRALTSHVEQGQRVAIEAGFGKVQPDRLGIDPRGLYRGDRGDVV